MGCTALFAEHARKAQLAPHPMPPPLASSEPPPACLPAPPLADLAAVYYALLRRTPWRQHIKLVVVTPEGLPMTQPEAQLLPTLSRLSVQSFADFSRRLLPGHQIGQEVSSWRQVLEAPLDACWLAGWPAGWLAGWLAGLALLGGLDIAKKTPPTAASPVAQLDPQQAPASWEGGEQRCFQDLFFCGRKVELARGPPPEVEAAMSDAERAAALAKEVPLEPFSFGQAVVQHQLQQPPRQGQAAQDGISLQEAAAAAAAVKPEQQQEQRSKSSGRLRVLLMKRDGEGRQILNAKELLERCNAWQYHPPNGTAATVTADCREVRLGWAGCWHCGAARLV